MKTNPMFHTDRALTKLAQECFDKARANGSASLPDLKLWIDSDDLGNMEVSDLYTDKVLSTNAGLGDLTAIIYTRLVTPQES